MSVRHLSVCLIGSALAACAANAPRNVHPAAVTAATPVIVPVAIVAPAPGATTPAATAATTATAAKKVTPRPAPAPQQVYVTGSRIGVPVHKKKSSGTAEPTQSVSAQELELSGQTDPSAALKGIVPRMQPTTK